MTPLNPNVPPSDNFDLLDWKLTLPIDLDKNNRADEIEEIQLSEGFQDSRYFYTAEDGGMVFKAPIEGAKTSTNTKFTRTELREMLRQGNRAFKTKGVGGNNWVFSSAPSSTQDASGGVDGELTATLAVNHVTTTGDPGQVGRVIIGQLHASDDEPLRIYYRKLPNNSTGSIYIAHQPRGSSSDRKYDMIGSRSRSAPDPGVEGIALNEKFSYKVNVVGDLLTVTIMRPGKPDVVQEVYMADSGYDDPNEYMYFKAGVYNLNNSGAPNDYVKATFYALDNEHTGYSNPTPVDVNNVAPTITSVIPESVFIDDDNGIDDEDDDDDEGVLITVTGTFTDPRTLDIHTGEALWSDGVSTELTISFDGFNGTFNTTRSFSEDQIKDNFLEVGDDVFQLGVTTTITDDDTGTAEEFLEFLVSEEGGII